MVRKRPWSNEDLKRLAAIVVAGGTPFRAAAALNRGIMSCQAQARKMGTPFSPQQVIRKRIREKCEAAERELGRR